MSTKQVSVAAPGLSARWTHTESEAHGINRIGKYTDNVGSGIGIGNVSSWSRATVWFRRPDDVKLAPYKPSPVKSLQALVNRAEMHGPPMPDKLVMSGALVSGKGKLEDLVSINAPRIKACAELADRVYRLLTTAECKSEDGTVAKVIQRLPPSQEEMAEIERFKEAKAINEKARLDRIKANDKAIKAKRK